MQQYIIFLRGVMPTGRNKVPMAPLREVLTRAGLTDVRTYIQSGNVLARSSLAAADIERLVHAEIERHFGGDIAVIARTPQQVRHILVGNPFPDEDLIRLFFVILARKPDHSQADRLLSEAFLPNRFAITDTVAYLYCPDGYSNSKINNNFLEKKLGVTATMRNYNTLTKLVELADALK